MKTNIFAIILLVAVFFTACSQESSDVSLNSRSAASLNSNVMMNAPNQKGSLISANNNSSARKISLEESEQTQNAPIVVERKIIRNADLTLKANSPEETQQKISSIVESKGGFVVESTQSTSDVQATTRDTVSMTIRVPAEKFDETLN